MTRRNAPKGLMTRSIHSGEGPDPTTGASAPALHMSSTFVTDQVAGFFAGHGDWYFAGCARHRAARANVCGLVG